MVDTAERLKYLLDEGRARCERTAGRPVVKPDCADLFAGTNGLPEIEGSELSVETLSAGLLHHGGLLVRQLYNNEQLEHLQRTALASEEANRGDHKPLGCAPKTLFDLLDIYQECGLLDVVGRYLDDEPVMFAERAKLRHHRKGRDKYAAIPWHQDVNFFGNKSYAVNCWAAITPCGEGNPGLGVVPCRVDERLGWDQKDGIAPLDYGRSIPTDALERLAQNHPIAYPILQPGDALLFDEMTVHQTALKKWLLEEQIVTISWFFRAAGFPDWGTPLAV